MRKMLILLFALFTFIGCHDIDSRKESLSIQSGMAHVADDALDYEEEIELEAPRTAEPQTPSGQQVDAVTKRSKIIKDGRMTLEVDSLVIAKVYIDSIVSSSKAYYEKEQYTDEHSAHRYILKIRVPNSNFERMVDLLSNGTGKVVNKSINANDVTAEYLDLQIRLDNNKAYLNQYRALLKKAKKIEEILEVQEKARRIETEIDTQLGRMKYINDQVNYSTLTVDAYQKKIHVHKVDSPSYVSRLWNSVKYGFYGIQEVILWVVALWPFIILLVSGIFLFRIYRKRRK